MPPKVMEKAASVSYPRVNELIHGKRGVTRDTALRLERLLGMEAQFWLNLQLAWDLYHVKHSPAAKEIAKVKKLPQRHEGVVGTEVVTFGYSVRTEDVRKNPDCREMGMVGRHL